MVCFLRCLGHWHRFHYSAALAPIYRDLSQCKNYSFRNTNFNSVCSYSPSLAARSSCISSFVLMENQNWYNISVKKYSNDDYLQFFRLRRDWNEININLIQWFSMKFKKTQEWLIETPHLLIFFKNWSRDNQKLIEQNFIESLKILFTCQNWNGTHYEHNKDEFHFLRVQLSKSYVWKWNADWIDTMQSLVFIRKKDRKSKVNVIVYIIFGIV